MSGLALGLYATTPPRVTFTDVALPYSNPQEHVVEPDTSSLNGPTEILCQGCGPTLADRQMAAMMGGAWSGYDDPAVRDYMAQDQWADEDGSLHPQDAQPVPAPRFPPNVERFAAGEVDAPQPVQVTQASIAPTAAAVTSASY